MQAHNLFKSLISLLAYICVDLMIFIFSQLFKFVTNCQRYYQRRVVFPQEWFNVLKKFFRAFFQKTGRVNKNSVFTDAFFQEFHLNFLLICHGSHLYNSCHVIIFLFSVALLSSFGRSCSSSVSESIPQQFVGIFFISKCTVFSRSSNFSKRISSS